MEHNSVIVKNPEHRGTQNQNDDKSIDDDLYVNIVMGWGRKRRRSCVCSFVLCVHLK